MMPRRNTFPSGINLNRPRHIRRRRRHTPRASRVHPRHLPDPRHALLARSLLTFADRRHLDIGVSSRAAGRVTLDFSNRVNVVDGLVLGLHEWPVAVLLVVAEGEEADDDHEPIEVVGENGADCGGVLPAENGVEDAPAAAAVDFGVAALKRRCVRHGDSVAKVVDLR